jgi:hypothetical protein
MLASSPASMVNHIEPRRRKRYRIGAFGSCSSIVILASFAIGLSACGTANSSLPMISAAQVASGQPLPEGILPNGIVYQPYNNG